MTLEDAGNLGELLAAIATIATLGYLAVQVGQARRQFESARVESRSQATAETGWRSAEVQLRWFSPSGSNPTMMKALLTDDRLTPEEGFEFAVQMSIFIGELFRMEQLHRRGLLDAEMVAVRRSIYMPYLAMPRVRKWWERIGKDFYGYDAEGCRVVQQMIEEIEGRPESDGEL